MRLPDLRRALSALASRATRLRVGRLKDWQIRWFVRHYDVDLGEAAETDPRSYPDFNSFFTRALRPGARPLPADPRALAAPADGTLLEYGTVRRGTVLQAKGRPYPLAALLGGDDAFASGLDGGTYLTLYLSPRDYHRVHCPFDAVLERMTFVPGERFSVAPRSVERVSDLFARNERVIFELEGEAGRAALIMVGALCVSSIETPWGGTVTGVRARPTRWTLDPARELARGDELARFNMGSTVILVVPAGRVEWLGLDAGTPIRLGQPLGTVRTAR